MNHYFRNSSPLPLPYLGCFGLILLMVGFSIVINNRFQKTLKLVGMGEVLEKKVVLNFFDHIHQVQASTGDPLEVGTIVTTEIIEKATENKLFGGWIDLGTTVSEIQVGVTYRYNVLLSGSWEVIIKNGIAHVKVPVIEATLPVSIHTDQIKKRTEAGWLKFDAVEHLEALEKNLTSILNQRAMHDNKLDLLKPKAKEVLENFVKKWILTEDIKKANIKDVKIYFSKEVIPVEE
jgi:hypothetical protein